MKGLLSSAVVVGMGFEVEAVEMARDVDAYCETMGASCIAPGEGVEIWAFA
jgi:hypothetical protein